MAYLLEIINSWFRSMGLGTDWTVTWEGLFSFGAAVVSLVAFAIKHLSSNKDLGFKKAKTNFEHQENDIFEGQSAIYFDGEVIIFFRRLDDKGQYFESVEGRIKFMGKDGKYKDESLDIETKGEWDTRSHSFQGFNDYIAQLIAFERAPDNERSKTTLSVIKIPRKVRLYKQIQLAIIAIAIGLLAHAVLLSRFGETITLSGNSFATALISGCIALTTWLWLKLF